MWRIIRSIKPVVVILVLSVILVFCSLATLLSHNSDKDRVINASCSFSCHTHDQNIVENNQIKQEEEEDEPVPPRAFWTQTLINLSLLYFVPVITVLWFINLKRKMPLTAQLRF